MADSASASRPTVDREKTAPFLIRTFLKIGTFHRLSVFEDGNLPVADEQQIFTWKDATLREVLTTLRNTAPASTEFRHPLARYTFRAIYADATNRGRFAQKDLGIVYSRDILGEPGTLASAAPRLLRDDEDFGAGNTAGAGEEARDKELDKAREERSLDELRFVPGDYLCVMVVLPKNVGVSAGPSGELNIKGAVASAAAANGSRGRGGGGGGDGGWGGNLGSGSGRGGGGHWRGESNAPRGRGGGRGDVGGRDRDRDRRVPPPRRESPPRGGRGGWGRDRRSVSRSRSPVRRSRGRYD